MIIDQVESSYNLSVYTHLNLIEEKIYNFEKSCNRFPSNENGLKDLLLSHSDNCWSENYLSKKLLFDPIGKKEYKYSLLNKKNAEKPFKIISSGIDGVFDTADDLTNFDSENRRVDMENNFKKFVSGRTNNSFFSYILAFVLFIIVLLFYLRSNKNIS